MIVRLPEMERGELLALSFNERHSNIAITLDKYSHLLSGIDEKAANKIDKLFAQASH